MSRLEWLVQWLIPCLEKQLLYSSLIAALVWLLCRGLGLRAPRLQQGLWALVLARLVLPTNLAAPWSLRHALSNLSAAPAPWEPFGLSSNLIDAGSAALPLAPASTHQAWLPLVLSGLWLAGAAFFIARMIHRRRGFHIVARQAKPLENETWRRTLLRWQKEMKIRRPVALVTSDACSTPFTVGLLRPRIFLPQAIVESWPREEVEPIIAHELAHIRRLDSLWIGLEGLVRALYFFHPASWLAGSRLDLARERVCDEMVLATGRVSRRSYGECLLAVLRLQIEASGPAAASAAVATFGNNKRRISMRLLGIVRHRGSESWRRVPMAALPWALSALLLPMGTFQASPSSTQKSSAAPSKELPSKQANPPKEPLLFTSPLPGARLTSPFGHRRNPLDDTSERHRGVDLVAKKGTEILAPADGRIEVAAEPQDEASKLGVNILLDHGGGVKTLYAHLDSLLVEPGDQVQQGQPIGKLGNSGVSTGPHLHFEIWRNGTPVDPAESVGSW